MDIRCAEIAAASDMIKRLGIADPQFAIVINPGSCCAVTASVAEATNAYRTRCDQALRDAVTFTKTQELFAQQYAWWFASAAGCQLTPYRDVSDGASVDDVATVADTSASDCASTSTDAGTPTNAHVEQEP